MHRAGDIHAIGEDYERRRPLSVSREAAHEVYARLQSTSAYSLLADPLGSTIVATDASGIAQAEYTYELFGLTASVGVTDNTAQFTAQENDGTGLYNFRARYYDPRLQRFLSEDPAGLAAGEPKLYAYVLGAPTRFNDPLGFYKRDVHYAQTRAIAQQVGLCEADAENIARWDQLMDELLGFEPLQPWNVDARALYYFPTPERLEEMREQAMDSGNVQLMGEYLHAFQDSFSHQRGRTCRDGEPYGPWFGHASDPGADDPRQRPDLWRHMIEATGLELWQFHQLWPGCNSL